MASSSSSYPCVVCPEGKCEIHCIFRGVFSADPDVFDQNTKTVRQLFKYFTKDRLAACLLLVDGGKLQETVDSFVMEMKERKKDARGLGHKLKELERMIHEKDTELKEKQTRLAALKEEQDNLRGKLMATVKRKKALEASELEKLQNVDVLKEIRKPRRKARSLRIADHPQAVPQELQALPAPNPDHPQALSQELQPPNENLGLVFTAAELENMDADLEVQNVEAGLDIPDDDLNNFGGQ